MSARPRRRAVGRLAMLVGAGTAVLVPLGAGALDPLRAAAADVYVAVVIDFGGGPGAPANVVQCVSVPAGSTDAQALSQVDDRTTAYATSGLLCGIDTYPPDAVANCRATSGDDYYFWSYWHGTGGTWVYANDGPAEQVVTSGDVEGWRFQDPGPASPSAPAPGTAPDFSAICADGAGQTTPGAASGCGHGDGHDTAGGHRGDAHDRRGGPADHGTLGRRRHECGCGRRGQLGVGHRGGAAPAADRRARPRPPRRPRWRAHGRARTPGAAVRAARRSPPPPAPASGSALPGTTGARRPRARRRAGSATAGASPGRSSSPGRPCVGLALASLLRWRRQRGTV